MNSLLLRTCGLAGLFAYASCVGPELPVRWTESVTDMQFVLLPAGRFVMGSTGSGDTLRPASPHHVRIVAPFYLGSAEVTQRQWQQVMGANPSQFLHCGPKCPVETVSWNDVQRFLERLNRLSPGEHFRLPTEAEWEYACRSGLQARYGVDADTLSPDLANYDPRIGAEGDTAPGFRGRPVPVGSFRSNAWGLSDMSGNLWEWTASEFCPYPAGFTADSLRSCGTDTMAIRGGSWAFSATAAQCGHRYTHARHDSGYSLGFRVVRDIPP